MISAIESSAEWAWCEVHKIDEKWPSDLGRPCFLADRFVRPITRTVRTQIQLPLTAKFNLTNSAVGDVVRPSVQWMKIDVSGGPRRPGGRGRVRAW